MTARTATTTRRSLHVLFLLSTVACQAPAEGTVLLDLASFASPDVPGLRDVEASLVVETPRGAPAVLNVQTVNDEGEEEWRIVTSPVPMLCTDGVCDLSFTIDPGNYHVALDVFARDRCGTRAQVATALPSAGNPVSIGGILGLTLDDVSYAFDDDDDGIENVLESLGCGRFDLDDGVRAPLSCRDGDDPCCLPSVSDRLLGKTATFVGGAHTRADGTTTTVAPFVLDATEMTMRALVRCVTAGACLAGEPDHPVRERAETAAPNTPVTGLTPGEAQSLCAWRGMRLPTDDEWDFAAANDGPGARRALPFDEDAPELLLLVAGDPGGRPLDEAEAQCAPATTQTAFNHRAIGETCPLEPLEVGSYPTSHHHGGEGAPLADMAGNVAEWTADVALAGPSSDVVPQGVGRLRLRGGYYSSPPLLVENDYPISVMVDGAATPKETVAPFLEIAGVRCAASLDVAPDITIEPACPSE